jgi:mxaJ protein
MKFGGVLILPLLLIPAQALTACADPNYLPYSDRAGEGFENKVAVAVAKALGEPLEYTWASHRGHGGFTQFLSTTLDAKKCDVVMSIPYGSREELTTRPYYISSYVFVYPKSKKYNITTMDAPVLKSLKIGFERDTPAEDSLKIRGMIPELQFRSTFRMKVQSPQHAGRVEKTKIDVLITRQPAIGAFLPRAYPDFKSWSSRNSRAGAPEQYSFPCRWASAKATTPEEEARRRDRKAPGGAYCHLTRGAIAAR